MHAFHYIQHFVSVVYLDKKKQSRIITNSFYYYKFDVGVAWQMCYKKRNIDRLMFHSNVGPIQRSIWFLLFVFCFQSRIKSNTSQYQIKNELIRLNSLDFNNVYPLILMFSVECSAEFVVCLHGSFSLVNKVYCMWNEKPSIIFTIFRIIRT